MAITALSVAVIGTLLVGFIWIITRVLSFLQPILIPFAVAGVIAYLLEPVVVKLKKWGLSRQTAVWVVFTVSITAIVGISFIIVPAFAHQGAELAGKMPEYTRTAKKNVTEFATKWNEKLKEYGVDLLHWETPASQDGTDGQPAPVVTPSPTTPPVDTASPDGKNGVAAYTLQDLLSGDWVGKTLPEMGQRLWDFVRSSVGGFLGIFGFFLSMIIVPLYLYYFLTESPKITNSWSNYVPLRASEFKDDVVDTLTEINRYLIAFFRGQLVVSLINGFATGLGLVIVGVKFGWLIGLVLCVLGIIPYLGIIICWIPAVIIASVQGGSYLVPADSPWWVFPLVVTAIFVVVQQIDGLFITPKIVGDSVGLHPMTVIVSVFVWSLIMGGLLGAILAVPMTAAMKVLFQRYIWQRGVQRRWSRGGGGRGAAP
ncbi:AI-2E family transporter [Roseimicrobium gellanilyticum]|nr:AI-2E family transporter [Roseimicrobium gellanilyticum]